MKKLWIIWIYLFWLIYWVSNVLADESNNQDISVTQVSVTTWDSQSTTWDAQSWTWINLTWQAETVPEKSEITIPKLQIGIAKKHTFHYDYSLLVELDLNC